MGRRGSTRVFITLPIRRSSPLCQGKARRKKNTHNAFVPNPSCARVHLGVKKGGTMPYDLLIKNGTVIDGSGLPRFRADVAIVHGKIAAIGKIRDSAKQIIDAEGHV